MEKKTQLFVEVKVQHQRVTGAGGDLAQAFETWTSSRLKGTPLVWFPCGGGGSTARIGGDWGVLRPREVLCQGSDAAGSPSSSAGLRTLRPPGVDGVEGRGPPGLGGLRRSPGRVPTLRVLSAPSWFGAVTWSGKLQLVFRGPCPSPSLP